MKTQKPITGRIKTIKDVLKIAKPTKDKLQIINYKGKDRQLLGARAFLLAEIIADVFNEGVKLDWNNYDQKKWFGYYSHSKPGSGFSVSYTAGWSGGSDASARLFFKSEELFWKAVKTFPTVYKQLMTK